MSITAKHVKRYLALLDIAPAAPSIGLLRAIVRSHLWRVPFENISKLYRLKTEGLRGMPSCDEFLDGIERYHFGGTCYTNNFYLNGLLRALGFDAVLCGAMMSRPDVHLVSVVRCDSREYIVDAGNAAPFIEPMPCDLTNEYLIPWGTDSYIVHPKDGTGWPRISMIRDGEHKPQYTVNPAPRRIEEFDAVIRESFASGAVFMNAVLLACFAEERSVVLRNLKLTVVEGGTVRRTSFRNAGELGPVIHDHFGIPEEISHVALEGLTLDHRAFG